MTLNILSTYAKFDRGSGGQTGLGDFMLQEGGSDIVLLERENMIRIGLEGGDIVLIEGGSDELLTESRSINLIG